MVNAPAPGGEVRIVHRPKDLNRLHHPSSDTG